MNELPYPYIHTIAYHAQLVEDSFHFFINLKEVYVPSVHFYKFIPVQIILT